jgi:hypothetical protein
METEDKFTPEIYELISEPDNVEELRSRIAFIIKGETQNQYTIAQEQGAPDAYDFNFRVFVQNDRPYDTNGDEPGIEPIVNVMLQKIEAMDGSARMGPQKEKATFIIDCIAFGCEASEDWNEKAAAIRAWKAARVVRRILMSEQYTYLGLRGIVGGRLVTSIETGVPENGGGAHAVVAARIILEVQFLERAIKTTGPIIEAIDFTVDPFNGEVTMHNNQEVSNAAI